MLCSKSFSVLLPFVLASCGSGDAFTSADLKKIDAGPDVVGASGSGGQPEASSVGGSSGYAGEAPDGSPGGTGPDADAGAGGTGGSLTEAGLGGSSGDPGDASTDPADSADSGLDAVSEPEAETGPACPVDMVLVPPGYCIDATEVTREAYAAWLATSPQPSAQVSWCSWNTSFVPSCEWPPGPKTDYPVVCLNWCDAYAYCAAVGKRLCGKVGGGSNSFTDLADADTSQWYRACTAAGTRTYPYGSALATGACNTSETASGGSFPVTYMSACVGGYPGIFDMSGNVWEWEDSCDGNGHCQTRGGSYDYNGTFATCAYYNGGSPWTYVGPNVGFRCCT